MLQSPFHSPKKTAVTGRLNTLTFTIDWFGKQPFVAKEAD
jgi:hypothetical protein